MLCYRFESQNFQNAQIDLKLYWKYACDILTMIKHMICYSMSLGGHKGVRKSKYSKCSNWTKTWLKVCVWHSYHDKTFCYAIACH